MSTPIPYYLSDPDYYSNKDPDKKNHIANILRNSYISNLITMASVDNTYSILVRKSKDA